MPRYALKIEYDGQPFSGWQRQKTAPSVQQCVEDALGKLESNVPSIVAAGRTDAGVHALGQVAHCDMAKDWDPFRLSEALNHHLKPNPISITAAAAVDEEWHARFSAIERRYMFRLIVRRAPLVHHKGQAWRVNNALDVAAMRQGAAHLIGRHDYTTFRASICQAQSALKSIDEITIAAQDYPGGQELHIHVRARSFLHNQVRSIVGTLERVGAGAWDPDDVKTALEARDRAKCGPVSPPDGLYLMSVGYPDDPFG